MKYPNKAITRTRPPWMKMPIITRATDQASREGEERSKEYDSQWAKYSKQFLASNPICVKCGELAKITDHAVPINMGGSKYDKRNHDPLCDTCHNKKRGRERHGKVEASIDTPHGRIPVRNMHLDPEIGNQTHMLG